MAHNNNHDESLEFPTHELDLALDDDMRATCEALLAFVAASGDISAMMIEGIVKDEMPNASALQPLMAKVARTLLDVKRTLQEEAHPGELALSLSTELLVRSCLAVAVTNGELARYFLERWHSENQVGAAPDPKARQRAQVLLTRIAHMLALLLAHFSLA